MTLAYRIIRSEHYEIGLVTHCLENLSGALHGKAWMPDFDLLFLLLDYVESFPATFHHPKEEDYLFKAIRFRNPGSSGLIDRLCADHADGLDLISELRQSLEMYSSHPEARRWFCHAAQAFSDHEQRHMQREERTVLPLALQVLTKDDWVEINTAFEENSNPLFNDKRREKFDQLFALILQRIPSAAVINDRKEEAV